MFKAKNLKKSDRLLSVLVMAAIISFMPLKAEKDNDGEVMTTNLTSSFTVITSQELTPLGKPSFESFLIYDFSKNKQSFDFLLNPVLPKTEVTKYPNTYRYIQEYKKSHRFEKSLFEASLIANLALNAADYFSTREALKYDGLQEGNPFMKPFVKDDMTFAAVKIGLTVGNYFMMKKLFKRNKTLGWIMSIASNLALSYVVSNNMAHIYEARNK